MILQHSSNLFSSPYFFHLHTVYTDGHLKVQDYFDLAREHKISNLIFLEHIRKQPNYDVDQFIQEIHAAEAESSSIQTHVGFEAKILPDGTLDIAEEHFERAKVIGIAEHGFPDDVELFYHAWKKVIKFASTYQGHQEWVWVHPGLFFQKRRILNENLSLYQDMLEFASTQGILIERNSRYHLIPEDMIHDPQIQESLVYGIDAHKEKDVRDYIQTYNLMRIASNDSA